MSFKNVILAQYCIIELSRDLLRGCTLKSKQNSKIVSAVLLSCSDGSKKVALKLWLAEINVLLEKIMNSPFSSYWQNVYNLSGTEEQELKTSGFLNWDVFHTFSNRRVHSFVGHFLALPKTFRKLRWSWLEIPNSFAGFQRSRWQTQSLQGINTCSFTTSSRRQT